MVETKPSVIRADIVLVPVIVLVVVNDENRIESTVVDLNESAAVVEADEKITGRVLVPLVANPHVLDDVPDVHADDVVSYPLKNIVCVKIVLESVLFVETEVYVLIVVAISPSDHESL